jgi:PAS domain S-box-containing protein
MPGWLFPSVVAALVASVALWLAYAVLGRERPSPAMRLWTWGWGLYGLRFAFTLLALRFGPHPALSCAELLSTLGSALLILAGAEVFRHRRLRPAWALAGAAAAIWTIYAVLAGLPFAAANTPAFFFTGAVLASTGLMFLRLPGAGRAAWYSGLPLVVWGLHKFDYPFLRTVEWFAPWGFLLGAFCAVLAAVGILLAHFEFIGRDVQRSERRYRRLVESAADPVFLADAAGRLREVNEAACRTLGYTREELLDLTVMDVDRDATFEDFTALWKDAPLERPVVFETMHRRKDGASFPVELKAVAFVEDGERYLLGQARDISGRKAAEARIAALNASLESRVEALTRPVGDLTDVAFADVFDLEDIQRIQDAFADATGVASIITDVAGRPLTRPSNFCRLCSDIIRRTPLGLANCQHSDAVLGRLNPGGPIMQPCLSGGLLDGGASITVGDRHIANWLVGQVLDSEDEAGMLAYARQIGADEAEYRAALAEVTRMPREQFAKVCQALYLIATQLSRAAYQNLQQARFITERGQAEEAMRAAKEEAEAASRVKSLFLANMSHEIRTPLNGLLGMLQLLRLSSLGPEQAEYVDTAILSGRRLTSLLSDILDLTRVESGKLRLNLEPFPVRGLFADLAEAFGPACRERGIALRQEAHPSLPERLVGDESRIRQILFNLVGNAVKFTPAGEVVVRASAVAGAQPGQVRVLLTVEDTGIGIPEDKLDSIFESFSQVENASTRRFQGAGLGLAIVRRLVELMDGTISIQSEPGRGATVSCALLLHLPPAAEPEKRPADRARTAGKPRRLNILVVEDEVVNRTTLRLILVKLGHQVAEAGDGLEALDMLKTLAPDCILMDVQMPGMDGLEATRAIRTRDDLSRLARTPIIAITAHAMSGDREKILAAGMDGYVAKPIAMEELERVLATVPAGSAA